MQVLVGLQNYWVKMNSSAVAHTEVKNTLSIADKKRKKNICNAGEHESVSYGSQTHFLHACLISQFLN